VSPPNSFTLSHTSDTSSAGCLPSGKPATREIGLNCLLRLIDCDDHVVSVFRSASLFRTRPETLPAPVDRRSGTPAGLSPPPKFGVSSPSPPPLFQRRAQRLPVEADLPTLSAASSRVAPL
jgi:hypothetical protein